MDEFENRSSTADGFGFKRLGLENWLTSDPAWQAFAHPPFVDPAAAWVRDVLKHDLAPPVPLAIRKLFEVARGTLLYGFMFYPLLALGTEQIFRVLEAAVISKCAALNAPAKAENYSSCLTWLADSGEIDRDQYERWAAFRQMRNIASHPRDQNIFDPNIALQMLRHGVAAVHELFRDPLIPAT
jgi:hypothetical protein